MIQATVVGLDVHATSITGAILPPQSDRAEVLQLSGDLMQVRKLFRRLAEGGPVRSCYEASGAGFVLQRVLTQDGFCSSANFVGKTRPGAPTSVTIITVSQYCLESVRFSESRTVTVRRCELVSAVATVPLILPSRESMAMLGGCPPSE